MIHETIKRLAVPIDQLKPYPANPRNGDTDAIKQSLETNGQYRPIVVRKETGEILAGNHTYAAAMELGWPKIAATYVDVDDEAAKRIVLVDNRTNDLAKYDDGQLAQLLESLPDLEGTGYSADDLDRIIADLGGPLDLSDDVPDKPAKPKTRVGDLYLMGDHRLLCGDSTTAEDVERLLDGGEVVLIATDPPYGVDYADDLGGRKGGGRWPTISGDARSEEGIYDLLTSALGLVASKTLFLWYADKMAIPVLTAVANLGWSFAQQIVWVKNALVFGGSDYQWRHETAIYARKHGSNCYADRTSTTVWEFPKTVGAQHPTQKPVELFEIPIRNHTKVGELVYEPFAGSGSALLAAETSDRRCAAIELDPAYCDVIVERWENHTGQKAERQRG